LHEGFFLSYYYCLYLCLSYPSFLGATLGKISEYVASHARCGAGGDNALLQVELEAACSRLVEVEHRKWTLTFENEGLKRYLGVAHTAHDVVVKEKDLVQQAEQVKLQCF
jgi:hypothetical protein